MRVGAICECCLCERYREGFFPSGDGKSDAQFLACFQEQPWGTNPAHHPLVSLGARQALELHCRTLRHEPETKRWEHTPSSTDETYQVAAFCREDYANIVLGPRRNRPSTFYFEGIANCRKCKALGHAIWWTEATNYHNKKSDTVSGLFYICHTTMCALIRQSLLIISVQQNQFRRPECIELAAQE